MAGTWIVHSLRVLISDLNASGELRPDVADGFLWRIEMIYRELVAKEVMGVLEPTECAALEYVRQAYQMFSAVVDTFSWRRNASGAHNSQAPIVQAGNVGRPSFQIPSLQLEYLIQNRLSVPQIANIVGVSVSTVRRRMTEFDLSIRETYSSMLDVEVDAVVARVQQQFPTWGNRQMYGHFVSIGIRLPHQRIREAQRRVDPEGSILRQLSSLRRRRYSVPGPQSLWHIDGNHKLIRYIPACRLIDWLNL